LAALTALFQGPKHC